MVIGPFFGLRRKSAEVMAQAQADARTTQQQPDYPTDIWRLVADNLSQPQDKASFRQACKEFRAIIKDFPEEVRHDWDWVDPRAAPKSRSLMAACFKKIASLHPCEAFQQCKCGTGVPQGRTFETAAWDDEKHDDDFGN